jgi:hypothetical protein
MESNWNIDIQKSISQSSFFDLETIECIKNYSEIFEDPGFPPQITSLLNIEDSTLSPDKLNQWQEFEWKRIPDIYPGQNNFLKDVSCHDVKQGSLGNCYLLSVCSVIAEFPNRLKSIFIINEQNRSGIYCLKFYVEGETKQIVIDDRIPFCPYSGAPPFCKLGKSKNIWPILIEKAWAKYLGNYERTIAGHPHELFKILTGAPSYLIMAEKYNNEIKKNSLWNNLQQSFLNNYYVCAGTISKLSYSKRNQNRAGNHAQIMKEIEDIGLSCDHAYSCLFFYEFEASGKKIRLVKIRNPWGKIENSKLQGEAIIQNYINLPGIKENIGIPNQEGVCILTFEEFIKFFSSINICNYLDGYETLSHRIQLKPNERLGKKDYRHFLVFKIDLTYAKYHKNSKIFFSINKPTKLTFSKEDFQGDDQLYYSIFIGRMKNNKFDDIEYIGHRCGFDSMNFVEVEKYQLSEYIVLVHADPHSGGALDPDNLGYVSLYTLEEGIFIEQLSGIDDDQIFQSLMKDYYRKFSSIFDSNKKHMTKNGLSISNSFTLDKSNYGFLVFENLSSENHLSLTLSEIKCEYKMQLSGRGIINSKILSNYQEFSITPNDMVLVGYYKSGMTYQYSAFHIKSNEQLKKDLDIYGEEKVLKFSRNLSINYYSMKHEGGMCFKFINSTNQCIQYFFVPELTSPIH